MKKLLLFLLLSLLCRLGAEDPLRAYEFVREIKPGGGTAETLAIRFDNALYRHTDDGYGNIFLTDADGGAVPFAVRTAAEKEEIEAVTRFDGRITAFSRNAKDNSASFEFTLPEEKIICTLKFDTDLSRFDKKVDLIFFDAAGKTVRRDDTLKLFKYDGLYGNSSVAFAPVRAKKVQITLRDFTEKKVSPYSTEKTGPLDHVTIQRSRAEEFRFKKITAAAKEKQTIRGKEKEIPALLPELGRREEKGRTVIEIDAARVPVSSLVLQADDKRFARPAKIEFADKKGKILSLAAFEANDAGKKISLRGIRCDKIVVTVMNGDDAPLKNLRLSWTVPERLILARPSGGKNLRLYYGGDAPKKTYDIEKYADKLSLGELDLLTPGPETPASSYSPAVPKEKILRVLMWAVVIAAAAVMLGVVCKLLSSPAAPPPGE